MTLRRALMVLFLTVFAALSGCGDNVRVSHDPGLQPASAEHRTWVVTGVTTDGKPHDLVKGTEIRLRFEGSRLTITADCNTMSGGYSLVDTRLTVQSLATTEMGCDRARMEQDTWLAGLFAKTVQFMSGDDATIVSGTTVLALADREKVSPDKPLSGTKWTLDTIVDGQAASSVPADQTASLEINGDLIALKDGCNDGSGTVAIQADAITFGDIGFTTRPCPTSNQVVPGFAAVLTGTATLVIEENRLTVTKGDHALGFRAG
jgi:heat shock protein HslJ